ncbi:hypothetical protein HPB47_002051 [Ixodes persulcatus]|uniref:Uncharacterized protein n=1 Tax=Ixodes persulcatus TaxID=34615 RepID=A0AC60PMH3_IXOPE|nr:hypothetical protein HPB47_002051 [Ixodes persulcatus]
MIAGIRVALVMQKRFDQNQRFYQEGYPPPPGGYYGDTFPPGQDRFFVDVQYYDNAPMGYYDYAGQMEPPPNMVMAAPVSIGVSSAQMGGDYGGFAPRAVISSTEREIIEVEERRKKRSIASPMATGAAGRAGSRAETGGVIPVPIGTLDSSMHDMSSIERDMRKMYHERYPSEETTLTLFPERSLLIILVIVFIFIIVVVVLALVGANPTLPSEGPQWKSKPKPPRTQRRPDRDPIKSPHPRPTPGIRTFAIEDQASNEADDGQPVFADPDCRRPRIPTRRTMDSDAFPRGGKRLVRSLSKSVGVCDDFYDHVCTGFQQAHTVNLQNPEHINADTLLFNRMEEVLHKIITEMLS